MTTILISKETRSKLRNLGRKEQTYDDIIKDLLKESKKGSSNLSELDKPEVL